MAGPHGIFENAKPRLVIGNKPRHRSAYNCALYMGIPSEMDPARLSDAVLTGINMALQARIADKITAQPQALPPTFGVV